MTPATNEHDDVAEPAFLSATRSGYNAIASDYAEQFRDVLAGQPLARGMLSAYAETVLAAGGGPVVDVGCGPGPVTAFLDSCGLSVSGLDLSPAMVEVAHRQFPDLRFDVGSMTALAIPDATLAGVVAWYSIIHVPHDELPTVFAEFRRVLVPGGHVVVAFQVGDEPLHLANPFGHPVTLEFRRLAPDIITALLHDAGFVVTAHLICEPEEGARSRGTGRVPQAHLMARLCQPPC